MAKSISDKAFIYSLIDPRDNSIFYIGKTNDPIRRLRYHTNYKKNTPNSKFIRDMLCVGIKPKMEILEVISPEDWQEKERYYISLYRKMGVGLKNVLDGGDQYPDWTGKHHKEETKKKMSEAGKGRKFSDKHRANLSATRKRLGLTAKKVYMYDLGGNYICEYRNANVAGEETKNAQSSITRCCNGLLHRVRDNIFSYVKADKVEEYHPPYYYLCLSRKRKIE
jgi:hypothetical protein